MSLDVVAVPSSYDGGSLGSADTVVTSFNLMSDILSENMSLELCNVLLIKTGCTSCKGLLVSKDHGEVASYSNYGGCNDQSTG